MPDFRPDPTGPKFPDQCCRCLKRSETVYWHRVKTTSTKTKYALPICHNCDRHYGLVKRRFLMIILPFLLLALVMMIASYPLDRLMLLAVGFGITVLAMLFIMIGNQFATPASETELRFRNKDYQALFEKMNRN